MGYRRLTDRDGQQWEIRDLSSSEWCFEPVSGNSQGRVRVPAPGYEKDPFEVSTEELQRLLDAATGGGQGQAARRPSPFGD